MELFRADILDIKIPESSGWRKDGAAESERKKQWGKVTREVAKEIQESRKPFEDAIAEKQNKLQLLGNYSSAFSNNKIIQLKDLPLGSYNIMAMRETQTQFGEKYIMLLATDQNETLGLCYSNKEIERYMRENLTDEQREKIRDPKRNYLTLFEKPLAVLNITGWGRTPQRHVIVYCNLTLAAEMEKDSIKSLREQITREIQLRRKVKNCLRRSDQVCGFPICTGRRRNGALQAHTKFGRVTSGFDAHHYCNRLYRKLWAAETCGQAGRWPNLPGWGVFRRKERTVNGDVSNSNIQDETITYQEEVSGM